MKLPVFGPLPPRIVPVLLELRRRVSYSPPDFEEMLTDMRAGPRMYAHYREAFLMRVTTILEIAGVPFPPGTTGEFYAKHSGREGSKLLGLGKTVTDEWAKSVVDDAIKMLKENAT